MKVAFHVDQLWFSAPGGIGTYVREMLDALPAADPSLELVRFRSRWRGRSPSGGSPLTPDGRYPGVEVPRSIRTLYPSWDTVGRPALPASLDDVAIVHATNPAAVPPVHGDQQLVVTVHDLAFERFPELFPRTLAMALPSRAARGGETGRRDPGPVAEHRGRSDRARHRSRRRGCT